VILLSSAMMPLVDATGSAEGSFAISFGKASQPFVPALKRVDQPALLPARGVEYRRANE
jgi:hypothetical protein